MTPDVPTALILFVAGLLACFAGYRLFKLILGVYGFIAGALVATQLLAGSTAATLLIAAIIGGVLGAILFVFVYFLGVAIIGAGAGVLFVHALSAGAGRAAHPLLTILAAIVGAILALVFQRLVIIVATAFGGAWTAMVGAAAWMGERVAVRAKTQPWVTWPFNPAPAQQWLGVIAFLLGIIGLVVQLSGPSGRRNR